MKYTFKRSFMFATTLLALIFSALGTTPAYAATLVVTNTNDSGAGSLRDTLASASPGDTITFDAGLSGGAIYLASELTLTQNVTIDGSALASQITISGDTGNNGTGDVSAFVIYNTHIVVTLNSLIITKGAGSYGGGIDNEGGTLTITNSTLSNNSVTNSGGGIYNHGTLHITNSVLSGNSANFAGAIYNDSYGRLTVTNSTFSGNSAGSSGAIFVDGYDQQIITNSTFSGNSATSGNGGGIYNVSNNLVVKNSTFSGNTTTGNGGGIYSEGFTVYVANSTFSGNSSSSGSGGGGGIYNADSDLRVTNSTLFGNSANSGSGGGIYSSSGLDATNITLSGNSASAGKGGGIYTMGINYTNTLIANSTSGGDCVNAGAINTNNHNLVEDGSCSASLSGDPDLIALDSNGGPTQTMALNTGSAAINAGDNSICTAIEWPYMPWPNDVNGMDQRSYLRDGFCDIGAYEYGGVLSPAKSIATFSFASPAAIGVITGTNIAVTVPFGTDVTALAATFRTTGASVAVGATPQVSGTTENDFTNPVTYTVTAADASTQDYIVTVTVADVAAKDINTFSFEDVWSGTWFGVNGVITGTNIAVTVPFGTDVTTLAATFTTTGASVKVGATSQVSGTTINDFTNPVTYTVTAADATTKNYVVTVTVEPDPANKDITAFSFTNPAAIGVITGTNIALTVPFGTNVTALAATFTTTGASVKVGATPQVSGTTTNNFTNPVTYTVTAADDSTQDYVVTVTVAPNPAKDITAFSFTSPAVTGVITGTNIALTVPFGTNVTALAATFTTTGASVKVGATPQVSGTTTNNFTNPVTYTVTAADATTKNYIVTVTIAASSAKEITAFSFTSPTATGVITGTNIALSVPFGTNVTALVATFTTTGASVKVGSTTQVSGTTANDFTSPVAYTVTAADASTQTYTVTVTLAPAIKKERVLNGGFNKYTGTSKIPTSWKAVKFSTGDGKSTTKKEGTASVQILGTGAVKTLTQTITLSGAAGDPFTFSFWIKGSSIPKAGLCQAQVLFYSGAVLKGTKTVKCPTGNYNWRNLKLSSSAPAAYTKIAITFTYSKASGTVWLDGVSLIK